MYTTLVNGFLMNFQVIKKLFMNAMKNIKMFFKSMKKHDENGMSINLYLKFANLLELQLLIFTP
jgi:hypothetical protein